MAITNSNIYQDKIMGGLEGDPLTNISNQFAISGPGMDQGFVNQYNLEQRFDPMFYSDNQPEIPGFNFIDAPIETSFFKRMTDPAFKPYRNNPRTGIIDNFLMQKGNPGNTIIDRAKSGIGKGFDLGKTIGTGIISAITGIPFLGNVLTGITSQFENRPLSAGVIDEFGNVYDPETLNKLNALGGYYTDPARSARRRSKRIARMLERQKLGKKISLQNLAKLQAQEKAQREMQEKATKAMAAQNRAEGRGGYQSDFSQDRGFMEGKGTAAEMGSFKYGGIASL